MIKRNVLYKNQHSQHWMFFIFTSIKDYAIHFSYDFSESRVENFNSKFVEEDEIEEYNAKSSEQKLIIPALFTKMT